MNNSDKEQVSIHKGEARTEVEENWKDLAKWVVILLIFLVIIFAEVIF